jgi:protein-S-isoprenylcysteine O-methyltransferase Ste14
MNQEKIKMDSNHSTFKKSVNRNSLLKKVLVRLLMAVALLGAAFFLPAGTFNYWQAWVYMAILIIPATLTVLYLLNKAPDLLERRMKMKEKETEQKLIVKLSFVFYIALFLIPGFDKRFEWSEVPVIVVIFADLLIFLGYLLFIIVVKENRYASRVIEVAAEQKVISTGPYAVVRHPMYVSSLIIFIFSSLALGSVWGLIPSIFITLLIGARIINEEKVLQEELPGYREYIEKVKYRLIPGIW